ncbi:MAG: energy-coupling factor transporter transmembrane protein EcfT [Lachnospiraceae bacterium]|nr:energy-coupling factor transporter transmembrane protein EcfT [Lachnospiraceae bacterium]
MIRDITIGQYYQTKSVIHRLDPRVKLLGTLLFIIALFSYKNPLGYALGIAFMCMVIKLSHVPVKFITKGLKGIMMIMCITVVINLFLTAGTPLISFWKITITYEGLAMAVTMIIRLILLIMGSSIVTLTTTPNNLTDGLEKGLGFMKVFHVPVGDVAMMMSIALRFIPILLEETDRIMKAQLARGADFENGNLVKRAKALVPVLVPLFVSAFRRAGDLAMAMEARCYRGGDGRTKMKPLVYKKRDAVAYIILFAFMVLSIFLGRWSVITGFFNNIYLNILK